VVSTDNGLTTSYGYDAAGRQRTHTIVDGTTGVATTLDSEGRAVALSESLGGSGPYTGRWGYNLNDLPVTLTVPGGVHGALGYDPSSRLVTTTLSGPAVITLGNTHAGASQDTADANYMVGSSCRCRLSNAPAARIKVHHLIAVVLVSLLSLRRCLPG